MAKLILAFRNFGKKPKNFTSYPQSSFLGFVLMSEQTVITYLCNINWLLFITENGSGIWSCFEIRMQDKNQESRRLTWAGRVARMEDSRCAYRILVGKPEWRRPLWRPRHIWENNIKVDIREVGWGAWNGSICLRVERGSGFLIMR